MSKNELRISDDLSLPLETITNTLLVLARRRVGKSYLGAVMAEEMVHAGLPWVVLDPTGVWWGLTSSADGKSEGLPVIVIGGPHGHIPLEPSSGKVIANLVVDHPGWYVIDFSRLDHRSDEIRFAEDFGVQLYRRKQRKPSALHLFIDEADMFVPQKLPRNAKGMLDAYDALVRRGGVYGVGVTLISQRPVLVNTDVRTQCETLIALQTSAPLDQDPILDWVSRNGTAEQLEQIKKTLASLKVGQAWFFSPNSDVFQLIKIRMRETFNSSATPKPGAKPIEPKVFANIDMAKLGEEISATVERSKQEDPEFLRRQIAQLRRELAEKKPDISNLETKIERVEVPVIDDARLDTLRAYAEALFKQGDGIIDMGNALRENGRSLNAFVDEVRKSIEISKTVKPFKIAVDSGRGTDRSVKGVWKNEGKQITFEGEITGPMQRIIDAIAWMESIGLSKPQRSIVAFLAGYSMKSTGFTNPLGALRSAGLITYPNSDTVDLTDAGRAVANPQQQPLTTDDLHRVIFAKLPGPQACILRVLIDHYPDAVQREELAQRAGYSLKSTGFTNPLGALRSLGVIDYPSSSEAIALPVLFLE